MSSFFSNDKDRINRLTKIVSGYGKCEAVVESTANIWIRIHDALEDNGIKTVPANPYKTRIIVEAKIKSDKLDTRMLADLVRSGLVYQIHKSNKVKAVLSKYHPRIHLVFLPIRSPELNLIEVRWLWMQRQAINNSTFQNERDIGKAVSDWACDYNKKHRGKTSINSLHGESIYMFS